MDRREKLVRSVDLGSQSLVFPPEFCILGSEPFDFIRLLGLLFLLQLLEILQMLLASPAWDLYLVSFRVVSLRLLVEVV